MQYLMERLANPTLPQPGQFEAVNPAKLIEAQIQRLVSARLGIDDHDAASLLDFGMPHVVEQGMLDQHALQRYAARLTSLIERYEPRLLRPHASIRPTGHVLTPFQLVVTGKLAANAEPEQFFFELPR
jgi:predicted component of type VI protein secretion system